ncbi:1-acyl-sn-glycerol-3-phosphate acyltransferase [Defluviimonas sp. WL0024]|uniref:1-acyl-sn-glycerol-3-phosphate acyltransferase n=2 Tax=Albidovulum TaxID=205889 RepID=A0ABT3J3M4_9RHOB|nr:lysophospholipid acyltransferase family protein [Defluviimonas sp. WL0024]MCU9848669.1 1-acyl-sn-glycerol-3-phosphate acyltransferase [Defluviimonas sp. WL0024]MCW3782265.1 1-acyl-sn-glycerol-3-phosphate acyltransferase [Defluviimonas salinarum]
MTTWRAEAPGDRMRVGPVGIALATLRGGVLGVVTYGGLALLLAIRLVERPFAGQDRPVSPHVTRMVCRAALGIIGLRFRVEGTPMRDHGAIVANHASWLDIFTLNACQCVYFVSKSEVAGWPGIGWLARATGTAFIARDPRAAKAQQELFADRIRAGHRLLFFPEGTSTDGRRVLPFKSTLFAAFHDHGLEHEMRIQPVSVLYRAPEGQSPRFYGWWGDMAFAPHLLKTLAQPRQGSVEVVFHPPVRVDAFASRKDLARHCEEEVRARIKTALGTDYGS